MLIRRAEPIIGFAETSYDVVEPKNADDVATVRIVVRRRGDTNQESAVRFYTKNGNAESGKDYNPVSKGESQQLLAYI